MKKNNETNFGFKNIKKNEKAKKVGEVFNSVAANYDLMNNLMSFGLHKIWKKIVVETMALKPNAKILDIAAGTGDLTLTLSNKKNNYEIYHTDINYLMLKEGKKKLINNGNIVPSIVCDAENLPFPKNYFDCVTIGFGLRNMTQKDKALSEIYRVLNPGGKLIILEFSKVWRPLSRLYDAFSFNIVPKLGKLIANDEASYQYLVESIRVHPDQDELKKIMTNQGFENVSYLNLNAGIVAIHKGYKF
ncbi:bifunctional demethylmenaquinone methyltransferase/2-methoxy-6-polyprenyl-1,4-benzoquinol methylase UbiE [Methylophilaceae bacterium]|nr:bifunctional demethylmenaquinone methyltransferase/2-methoxy-6-polyprenyl-1,4-benzoquinol methylase UbiE [Methylophilaceae bacterium]